LGNTFLRDDAVAEYIVSLVPSGLDVIEVGPGEGVLTIPLARKSRLVYAIEVDAALAEALMQAAPPNVVVVVGDALELEWPRADFFVSNIPYSITSPLLLKLARCRLPAVVTVQREVAERLAAEPAAKTTAASQWPSSVTTRWRCSGSCLRRPSTRRPRCTPPWSA
jgi:16S rRNA (adenine1518-N6/adenine1519-N6)-dimethyltransferase